MRIADISQRAEGKLKTNDTSTLAVDLPALKQEFDTFLAQYQGILESFSQQ